MGSASRKRRRRASRKKPVKKRLRKVQLNFKGLKRFAAIFGSGKTQGITFHLGLFTKKAATKGALLEYGHANQVARPWLSSTLSEQSATKRKLLEVVGKFTRDAFEGRDTKAKTKKSLLRILQMHLYDQRFQAAKLTDSTIRQKISKGNGANAHLIGIDTFELATRLDVRTTGSLRRDIRGK
jgi:hypothetical protein